MNKQLTIWRLNHAIDKLLTSRREAIEIRVKAKDDATAAAFCAGNIDGINIAIAEIETVICQLEDSKS